MSESYDLDGDLKSRVKTLGIDVTSDARKSWLLAFKKAHSSGGPTEATEAVERYKTLYSSQSGVSDSDVDFLETQMKKQVNLK